MTFTRDSALWWFTIAGALIAYLISKEVPPQQWNYMDWLQFLSAVIATVAGKLATSPLASKKEVAEEREERLRV